MRQAVCWGIVAAYLGTATFAQEQLADPVLLESYNNGRLVQSMVAIDAPPSQPLNSSWQGWLPLEGVWGQDWAQAGFIYIPPQALVAQEDGYKLLVAFPDSADVAQSLNTSGLLQAAYRLKLLIVAPSGFGNSWDNLDNASMENKTMRLDALLSTTFSFFNVSNAHVATVGFGTGANAALTMGTANGDLFSHILALTPTWWKAGTMDRGQPEIFVSYGTADAVTSSSTVSNVVTALRKEGHDVMRYTYDGAHEVTPTLIKAALVDFFVN